MKGIITLVKSEAKFPWVTASMGRPRYWEQTMEPHP